MYVEMCVCMHAYMYVYVLGAISLFDGSEVRVSAGGDC